MAFDPISPNAAFDFEVTAMPSFRSGSSIDSVDRFLFRFAFVAAIFLVALLIAYLAQ
jgi:hypothetical protein